MTAALQKHLAAWRAVPEPIRCAIEFSLLETARRFEELTSRNDSEAKAHRRAASLLRALGRPEVKGAALPTTKPRKCGAGYASCVGPDVALKHSDMFRCFRCDNIAINREKPTRAAKGKVRRR